ncbi:DNA-3-methyladenine glycosylase 2 family protein [Arenivirga flava]|uniref:DNA-3-methyladenine glycosylase II n=1 Tax=Arenivirga flava TaxID=1930060 RepID=A0AA37UEG1_9MICO|nr:AlkA N-terminal domain-containing protein [Arenivirga flava]GMA27604.1 DNA-3-methyladenine glycosylase [Arenivirga flava]
MDFAQRYRIVASRDRRFDGLFVTAVTSTGIYCRPSCPARTPKESNVRFYPTSAAAHEAGFRACKRCLPEAVPGGPRWNLHGETASRALSLIGDGVVDREGVTGLAARLGYSTRQLGRLLHAELGAGPLALARARRAQTARALLTSTPLPIAEIAHAAGFGSIRQCNDTVREVFGVSPTELRARAPRSAGTPDALRLRLPVREPFDAAGLLAFLAARTIEGVERIEGSRYLRALRLPRGTARIDVDLGGGPPEVRVRLEDLADLVPALARVRRLLDADADPAAVDAVLGARTPLRASVRSVPGIRLPGSVDGTEMLVRAMVGQQITVAAARTQLGRLAGRLRTTTVPDALEPFPDAATLAERGAEALRGPARRIRSILDACATVADGALDLDGDRDPAELRAELLERPGIGPWTADYLLLRLTGAPDVLLDGDAAQRAGAANLGLPWPLGAAGEAYAPWRSYLGMHLWRAAKPAPSGGRP